MQLLLIIHKCLQIYSQQHYKQTNTISMQTILNSFLRPRHLSTFNPPIINISNITVVRKDHSFSPFTISLYSSKNQQSKGVVLYCHSFGSNKHQCQSILPFVIQNNMKLISFNFLRTNNQGKIDDQKGVVSFGYHESQQIIKVIQWIQSQELGPIILWGRSMGAVAALKSQIMKPSVSGMILDSPYKSLKQAIKFMISQRIGIPNILAESVYLLIKSSIQQSLGFCVDNLNLNDLLSTSDLNVPCLFIASKADKYFGQATQQLYTKYPSSKQLVFTQRNHGAPRQNKVLSLALNNITTLIKNSSRKAHKKSISINISIKQQYQSISRQLTIDSQQQRPNIASKSKTRKSMKHLKMTNTQDNKKKIELESIKEAKIIPGCFGLCSSYA